MTTLAKVFIVILAVASVAFSMLVIQYTVQTTNARADADANLELAKKSEALRIASETQLREVQASLTAVIGDYEKKLAELAAKLDETSTAFEAEKNTSLAERHKALALAGQVGQWTDMFKAADTERKQLQGQLTDARKQIAALQTENFSVGKTNQELGLQKRLYERQIRLLRERNVMLEQMAEKLRGQIRAFAAGEPGPGLAEPAGKAAFVAEPEGPSIKGQITEVRDSLASVSVGAAQGVRSGMEFIVYRGGQYLGKVKITRVWPDKAAGELAQVQGAIRRGDSVTDKF